MCMHPNLMLQSEKDTLLPQLDLLEVFIGRLHVHVYTVYIHAVFPPKRGMRGIYRAFIFPFFVVVVVFLCLDNV